MRSRILLAVAVVLACGHALSAHHSYAGFDRDPVTVKGRIESATIGNPHTLIRVRGEDEVVYTVVWSATNALTRSGLLLDGPGSLKELLEPGERITVTGRLKREDSGVAMLPQTIDLGAHGRLWSRGN